MVKIHLLTPNKKLWSVGGSNSLFQSAYGEVDDSCCVPDGGALIEVAVGERGWDEET